MKFDDAKTALEWNKILDLLINKSETHAGKEYISLLPLFSKEEIIERINAIEEIKNAFLENLQFHFSGIRDIRDICRRSAKGSALNFEEIFDVRQSLIGYNRIKKFIKSNSEYFPILINHSENIEKLLELETLLIESITDNCELNLKRYPAVLKLQEKIDSIKNEIVLKINKMYADRNLDAVFQEKIHDIRYGRYVILIKANMKGRIKGSVQDVSASGSTLYVEPESLSHLNTELVLSRNKFENEIEKILHELTIEIGKYSSELLHNHEIITFLDVIKSAAKFSNEIKGNKFTVSDKPYINLYSARHPLLQIYQETVIANDIEIGKTKKCIIISGANTGGKTVLLKTTGLILLMAKHGLQVPCSPDSEIGCFNEIMTDIGDDQNLSQSLSTFSGQIEKIKVMLSSADENTLILLDEIMSGTNPRQGSALAASILEELVLKKAKIIATTHYPEMTSLAIENNDFANASVSFDTETLSATYKLHMNIPGSSYTLEIAKIYNIPESIIMRAINRLGQNELSVESLVEKLHKLEINLMDEQTKTKELNARIEEDRIQFDKLNKQLSVNIKHTKEMEGIEFLDNLRSFKEQVSAHMKNLRKMNLNESSTLNEELLKTEADVLKKVADVQNEKTKTGFYPFDGNKAKSGDFIYIKTLDKEGKLIGFDKENKKAEVLLGIMKARYNFSEMLYKPNNEANASAAAASVKYKAKNNSKLEIPFTMQTTYNTIDLRGKRVEDALLFLEKEIDTMLLKKIDRIIIIHGHGTGAMKEAVREHLKQSAYTNNFRPGESDEGGDGVTVALING